MTCWYTLSMDSCGANRSMEVQEKQSDSSTVLVSSGLVVAGTAGTNCSELMHCSVCVHQAVMRAHVHAVHSCKCNEEHMPSAVAQTGLGKAAPMMTAMLHVLFSALSWDEQLTSAIRH